MLLIYTVKFGKSLGSDKRKNCIYYFDPHLRFFNDSFAILIFYLTSFIARSITYDLNFRLEIFFHFSYVYIFYSIFVYKWWFNSSSLNSKHIHKQYWQLSSMSSAENHQPDKNAKIYHSIKENIQWNNELMRFWLSLNQS